VTTLEHGQIVSRDTPALVSLNERLRDDYIADCQRGVDRWNQVIKRHGIDVELRLPHRGFHRVIGGCAAARIAPDGRLVSEAEWQAKQAEWLPTGEDQEYVASLMKPVVARAQFANWIAPPARGINSKPVDFEYVRLE